MRFSLSSQYLSENPSIPNPATKFCDNVPSTRAFSKTTLGGTASRMRFRPRTTMKYQYSHRCALRQPAVNEPRSTTRETPRHISPPPPWRKTASRESVWARRSRSSRVSRQRRRSPRGRSRFKRSALSCCPVDYLRYSSVPACRPRRPADISLLRRGPYKC